MPIQEMSLSQLGQRFAPTQQQEIGRGGGEGPGPVWIRPLGPVVQTGMLRSFQFHAQNEIMANKKKRVLLLRQVYISSGCNLFNVDYCD